MPLSNQFLPAASETGSLAKAAPQMWELRDSERLSDFPQTARPLTELVTCPGRLASRALLLPEATPCDSLGRRCPAGQPCLTSCLLGMAHVVSERRGGDYFLRGKKLRGWPGAQPGPSISHRPSLQPGEAWDRVWLLQLGPFAFPGRTLALWACPEV